MFLVHGASNSPDRRVYFFLLPLTASLSFLFVLYFESSSILFSFPLHFNKRKSSWEGNFFFSFLLPPVELFVFHSLLFPR